MSRIIAFVLITLSAGIAVAQPIVPGTVLIPISQSAVDLGDVVESVVIAKVLVIDSGQLHIAKFGTTETIESKLNCVQLTRTVMVDDKEETQKIKLVTDSFFKPKINFTPTPQEPSISINDVIAFDLSGNQVPIEIWTKALLAPKHVLLIREPLSESVKLNPFYSALLKEDTLLLFLKKKSPEPVQEYVWPQFEWRIIERSPVYNDC